jgi:hypothetical protein
MYVAGETKLVPLGKTPTPVGASGEISSVDVLFFRLLLKNTERCPRTAA